MDRFTQTLKTNYKKLLDSGRDKDTLRDRFVWELMTHELPQPKTDKSFVPRPANIYGCLLDDERIDNNSFCFERRKKLLRCIETLTVEIAPMYHVELENTEEALVVSFRANETSTWQVRFVDAAELAEWIIRQKLNLETYLTEWENVVSDAAKKAKTRRLVVQAVKALATETLRPYPNVKYDIFEQSRRVKLMVRFLNSNLGLNIYAYYGSYKKTLPPQLEDLKRIIEVLSHNAHKTFFTYTN